MRWTAEGGSAEAWLGSKAAGTTGGPAAAATPKCPEQGDVAERNPLGVLRYALGSPNALRSTWRRANDSKMVERLLVEETLENEGC